MNRQEMLNAVFEYLRYIGAVKNKTDFAQKIGIDKSSLSTAFSGGAGYLTRNLFVRIGETFPQIDSQWLLTGEGKMLSEKATIPQITTIGNSGTITANNIVGNNNQLPRPSATDSVDHVAYLNTIISQKDEIIRQKDAQIEQLLQLLKTYTGK